MIDLMGIVLSTMATLYVIFRAAALDASLPWFETESDQGEGDKRKDNTRRDPRAWMANDPGRY